MIIDGMTVQGAQNIFFAELASKSTQHFSVSATRFMSGKFPFMIFGLPAAAFAMYKAARPEKKKLVDVTRECFFKGIEGLCVGSTIGDIGAAVQKHAESNGFSVVRDMVGHGVGRKLHEDPSIPNFGKAGTGVRIRKGMTLAIEPMINMGGYEVVLNGWSCKTKDGLPSAHYENTIAVTDDGVEILTL